MALGPIDFDDSSSALISNSTSSIDMSTAGNFYPSDAVIQIPEDGAYLITANANITNTSDGLKFIGIAITNAQHSAILTAIKSTGLEGQRVQAPCTIIRDCVQGEYLCTMGRFDTGSSARIISPQIQAIKLGKSSS